MTSRASVLLYKSPPPCCQAECLPIYDHMIYRVFVLMGFTLAIIAGFCGGCGKSGSPTSESDQSKPVSLLDSKSSAIPALRLHWIGKHKLAITPDATNLMTIWNMPESVRLENRTLDKLATAPWRFWATNMVLSNVPSALLRPVLEDLLRNESYLEAFGDTNRLDEFIIAVQLPQNRALVWQTNLPMVIESIFGMSSPPPSPNFEPPAVYKLQIADYGFQMSRFGDWTLVSVSHQNRKTAALLTAFQEKIKATQSPRQSIATNDYWLELQADFGVLPRWALLQGLQTNQPQLDLKVMGDGKNIRTLGEVVFPGMAPIETESWNIPTNIVHDPLISFTTWRGLRLLLKECLLWDTTQLGVIPNQATFWAQAGTPALRFFSFPSPEPDKQISALNEFVLKKVNPQLAKFPNTTNVPLGLFELTPEGHRLKWRGIPYILPNLDLHKDHSNSFIVGGLFPNRITNLPAPQSLLAQFQRDSDLILYDWELTQPSEFGLIQASQALRFVFGRDRLSLTNNPGLSWLVAISTNLGECTTSLRLSKTNTVVLHRISTIGLSSLEIHLLVEWLESETFPEGFFSLSSD